MVEANKTIENLKKNQKEYQKDNSKINILKDEITNLKIRLNLKLNNSVRLIFKGKELIKNKEILNLNFY